VRRRPRAFAAAGAAGLAALVLAGCGTSASSSSASTAVTVSGHTLTIFLSEPHDISSDPAALDVARAEQLAFAHGRAQVHDFKLQLQTDAAAELSDNARAAIIYPSTIAYMGEIEPGASDQTVGITNALDVLQVSPTDNALELSNSTPAVSGGPKSFFESWATYGRTFARLVPSGGEEARAQIAQMRALGISSVYVASDASDYGRALADAVAQDARTAGMTVTHSPAAAGAVFYAAQTAAAAAHYLNRVAARAPRAKLFGPSSLNFGAFASLLTPAAAGRVFVSIPGYLPRDLTAAGRAFVAAFRAAYHHSPNVEAIFGYAAMTALLHVLAHEGAAANDRTADVRAFLTQRNVASLLGSYSINSAGNSNLDAFVFAHVRGGRLVPFAAAPRS
jgi:ABC-type branched-subunit amino acid transport system substrate-binding protein